MLVSEGDKKEVNMSICDSLFNKSIHISVSQYFATFGFAAAQWLLPRMHIGGCLRRQLCQSFKKQKCVNVNFKTKF